MSVDVLCKEAQAAINAAEFIYVTHVPKNMSRGFVELNVVERYLKSGGVGANRQWCRSGVLEEMNLTQQHKSDNVPENVKEDYKRMQDLKKVGYFYSSLKQQQPSRNYLMDTWRRNLNEGRSIPRSDTITTSHFNWYFFSVIPQKVNNGENLYRIVYKIPKDEFLERFLFHGIQIAITPWIVPQTYLHEDLEEYGLKEEVEEQNKKILQIQREWTNMSDTDIDGRLSEYNDLLDRYEYKHENKEQPNGEEKDNVDTSFPSDIFFLPSVRDIKFRY